jgi:hypothetical protein
MSNEGEFKTSSSYSKAMVGHPKLLQKKLKPFEMVIA